MESNGKKLTVHGTNFNLLIIVDWNPIASSITHIHPFISHFHILSFISPSVMNQITNIISSSFSHMTSPPTSRDRTSPMGSLKSAFGSTTSSINAFSSRQLHTLISPVLLSFPNSNTSSDSSSSSPSSSTQDKNRLLNIALLKRACSGIALGNVFRNFVRLHLHDLRRATRSLHLPDTSPATSTSTAASDVAVRVMAVIVESRPVIELEYVVRNVMHFLHSDNSATTTTTTLAATAAAANDATSTTTTSATATASDAGSGHRHLQWGLQVHHSTGALGNEAFVRHVLRPLGHVSFVPLPFDVTDRESYSKLLLSESFWSNLLKVADKVLIFQTDSMMLRSGIDKYLKYDYIGAPWRLDLPFVKESKLKFELKQASGNGGFTLRDVKLMLSILWEKQRFTFNEDLEFVKRAERLIDSFPHRFISYTFSVETPCEDIPLDIDFKNASVTRYRDVDFDKLVNTAPVFAYPAVSSSAPRPVMPTFIPLGVHQIWVYFNFSDALSLIKLSLPPLHSHATN